jgi:hypothetical protein
MKLPFLAAFGALVLLSFRADAQSVVYPYIGDMPVVEDSRPMQLAYSGYEIITFRESDGNQSPFMRSAVCDARLTQILTEMQRMQMRLRASEIRAAEINGRHFVLINRYVLAEVKPQDARERGVSMSSLAQRWARNAQRVLPQILPEQSRLGI